MNIPVFCRLLGDVQLKEVSVGSLIYDVANAEIDESESLFTYEMSGTEMYKHYRGLTPRSRLALEDTQPLTKQQWQELVRETEAQNNMRATDVSRIAFYTNAAYAGVILFCYMLTTFVFIGYVANLSYNGESVSSVIFTIFTDVVKESPYITGEQDVNTDTDNQL